MPAPRAAQNLLETRMGCAPAQHGCRAAHRRDQLRRITGPARPLDRRHRAPSHAARRIHDFANGAPGARTQVHSDSRAFVELDVQGAQMRIGDIGDVDVIPNGSAVGRRIIGAVDLERRARAQGSSQHIVGHILLRLGDRLRDQRKSGQMDDRLDALALEERLDQLAVPHPPLDEAGAPGDRLAAPRAQVIQHNDLETPLQELIYDDTADVPCPSGDENPCHAGGSIPKSRRTASSRPYPWPSSAAFFRAMVGWCRSLFSSTWLNCSTWARSSGLRCSSWRSARSSSAARTSSMRARSSLMVGTTPRPPYQAQKRSVSSSTMRSAAGISSWRRAVACAATVCRSSTSYRNTFSSCAIAGSTSRGIARSRMHSGFPRRAPMIVPTRSHVTTACGAAVEQRAMSVVAKCGQASSSDTALPPSRSAIARARSCVRLATSVIWTPSALRQVAASSAMSPAPRMSALRPARSPKILPATATPAEATDAVPMPRPVSVRTREPTCNAV